VIALIEVRPSRYHYVVVIGASADRVVFHDPARGPSRVMSTQSFESVWAKSNRWMLVLLPGSGLQPDPGGSGLQPDPSARSSDRPKGQVFGDLTPTAKRRPDPDVDRRPDPCGVAEAVQVAKRGDALAARNALEHATATCGQDAAPWRELAGLD